MTTGRINQVNAPSSRSSSSLGRKNGRIEESKQANNRPYVVVVVATTSDPPLSKPLGTGTEVELREKKIKEKRTEGYVIVCPSSSSVAYKFYSLASTTSTTSTTTKTHLALCLSDLEPKYGGEYKKRKP